MSAAINRPRPKAPKDKAASKVQIMTRLKEESRDAAQALAKAEGLTMQQLGVYAWSLAMQAYGKPPLSDSLDP